MAERDDVSKRYVASGRLGTCCSVLFWVNVFLAFASLLSSGAIANTANIVQSVAAIAYVILAFLDDYHYWYFAERTRRRHLVENAFDIDLTNSLSEGYYNNEMPLGEKRLVANAFESVFFTSRIVKAMAPWAMAKGLLVILTFVAVIMTSHLSSLFPIITQTVFSSYLLGGAAKVLIYDAKLERLYDEMYRSCVTLKANSRLEITRILVDVEEYECLKAHFKVRLSKRLYNKLNPALSEEWTAIAGKIGFDEPAE